MLLTLLPVQKYTQHLPAWNFWYKCTILICNVVCPTLNGISFDKLCTVFQQTFTHVIHCLAFIQSHIYMRRGHLIYMEPALPEQV